MSCIELYNYVKGTKENDSKNENIRKVWLCNENEAEENRKERRQERMVN